MRSKLSTLAVAFTAAIVPSCKSSSKTEPVDKTAACTNIYKAYQSSQDMKTWMDACTAAPDENVRCVNLIMEEAKDADCKKLSNSEARNTLVKVLNGRPAPVAPPSAPAPAPAAAAPKPGLADGLVLEFIKPETDGDATFKLTNNTASCALTSIGYKGYAYDKSGTQLGGSGAGKHYDEPLAVGASKESKFNASSKYKPDGIAQIVITSIECADGTKWEDSDRAPFTRPMTPVK